MEILTDSSDISAHRAQKCNHKIAQVTCEYTLHEYLSETHTTASSVWLIMHEIILKKPT